MASSMGFLLLSIVFTQHTALANNCCQRKTVGNVSYHLVGEGETNIPGKCLSSCIYEADGKKGSRYCFAHGELPVHCLECEEWKASRIIPGGLDWARGHYHEHSYNPELTAHVQINNGETVKCNTSSPYRTIDGRCNNLNHKHYGASGTPFQRFIRPAYENDSYGTPRGGFTQPPGGSGGSSLPSPRNISTQFHNQMNKTNYKISNLFYQFGQFVAHDTGLTPEVNLDCIAGGFNNTACATDKFSKNPKCFNINITNDAFYEDKLPTYPWLGFARTLPCNRTAQKSNREQINAGTSFLDASIVYGFNITLSEQLRSNQSGKLIRRTDSDPSKDNLLPILNTVASDTGLGPEVKKIAAGDPRVNMHPFLLSVQTMFFREHNRLAEEIKNTCSGLPSNDDEFIFQSARRILIAQYQNIIYEEFLHLVVGRNTVIKYNLALPSDKSKFTDYNSTANPTTHNGFQTAAMRFGHSMIQEGKLQLQDLTSPTGDPLPGGLNFRDNYFNDANYTNDGTDEVLGGLSIQGCQHFDRYVSKGVTNQLYNVQGMNNYGDDLASRNIQRGRDHGLPSYFRYRKFCGLSENLDDISIPNRILLTRIYNDIDEDIDVWTGGLAEDRTDDAIVGPLFQCLIGKQFKLSRDGDRFFFTHEGQTGSFNSTQLKHIRMRTMRDLICENSPDLKIRKHALEIRDHEDKIDCKNKTVLNKLDVCTLLHHSP